MKALLDTHTFLWWNLDDPQLSATARAFIGDGQNEIFVSAASAWEIALKYSKGRLFFLSLLNVMWPPAWRSWSRARVLRTRPPLC